MIYIIIADDSDAPLDALIPVVCSEIQKATNRTHAIRFLVIANERPAMHCLEGLGNVKYVLPAAFVDIRSAVAEFLSSQGAGDRLALFLDYDLEFNGNKCQEARDMQENAFANALLFWTGVVKRFEGSFVRAMTMHNHDAFQAAVNEFCLDYAGLIATGPMALASAMSAFYNWLIDDFKYPGADFLSDDDYFKSIPPKGNPRRRADWFSRHHTYMPHDPPRSPSQQYWDETTAFLKEYVGSVPDFLSDVVGTHSANVIALHEHLKGFVGVESAFDNKDGTKGLSLLGALLLIIRGSRSKGKNPKVTVVGEGGIGQWLINTEKKSAVRDVTNSRLAGRALYDFFSSGNSVDIGIQLGMLGIGGESLPTITFGCNFDFCKSDGESMCVRDAALPPLDEHGRCAKSAGATGRALNQFLVHSGRTPTGHRPMFIPIINGSVLTLVYVSRLGVS